MAELAPWDDLQRGVECPFDFPRTGISAFMHRVKKLSVSTLYLSREQVYRGLCVLIFDPRHVTRIDELTREEWSSFASDLGESERAVFRAFAPDHINVASLGSTIPHLHWHIIPRYKSDPRWGGPIWTTLMDEMPRKELSEAEYEGLISEIERALDDDA